MIITGLDLSITHSGAVSIEVDEAFNLVNTDWLTFTTVKKLSSERCIYYNSKDYSYSERYAKYAFMHSHLINFCKRSDAIAIEDYSFNSSNGRVFDLAEFEGWLRQELWKSGTPIYLYSPMTIKKIFTGHGDSDKISMWEAFNELEGVKPDLFELPEVNDGKRGTPSTSDVIDAFAVAYTLKTELYLRSISDEAIKRESKTLQEFNKLCKKSNKKISSNSFVRENN